MDTVFFFGVDPLPSGRGGGGGGGVNQEVASMGLKIKQRIAIGLAVFPFPQIYSFQKSYGFRAI